MQNKDEQEWKIFRMKPEANTIKVRTIVDYYSNDYLGEFVIDGATNYIDGETLKALYEEVNE